MTSIFYFLNLQQLGVGMIEAGGPKTTDPSNAIASCEGREYTAWYIKRLLSESRDNVGVAERGRAFWGYVR